MAEETPEEQYKRGLELFGKKDFINAFEAWRSSADRGYAKAMCDVGWMFSQGKGGVPKDNQKAFDYMLKAAQKGYVRAQNNVGLYFKNGTGCEIDIANAVYWLEQAEKANYEKLAENTLKNCRALLAIQLKSDTMSPEEEHAFGITAFTNKDYKTAFYHWLNAANAGNAEAMCDVGWMYSQGHGVWKDDQQAFRWMLESAKRDYVRAQNNIGLYYKNGTGTPVNLEKAVEWLEKAEAANYQKLARKTLQEARELLAKKKDDSVEKTPQELYASGLENFGQRKYSQAFEYWTKAAKAGYAKAMCDVGWMYSQGHGVPKDDKSVSRSRFFQR